MRYFAFTMLALLLGAFGALVSPFWPILVYYGLAVLRPHEIWAWSLDSMPSVRWSFIAAIIAIISVAIHGTRVFQQSRFNPIMILMLIYGMLVLLSAVSAENPFIAWPWMIELAKILLMFYIASLVFTKPWMLHATAVMMLLCLGYHAYSVNVTYFLKGQRLDIFHYGLGGLDNNGAGALIALGLPFAYAMFFTRVAPGAKFLRIAAFGLAPMMAHSVMMTYSRSAMLAALVAGCWILVHHRVRYQAVGMAAAGTLGVLILAGPEIRDRFLSTADYKEDTSAQLRFDSWAAAWQIAWVDPITGKGVRNSNLFSQGYGADKVGRTIHNQYLQIAADSGIPALIVYVSMLGGSVLILRRQRKNLIVAIDRPERQLPTETRDRLQDMEKLLLGLQAAILSFGVSGMFLSAETFEAPWLFMAMAGVCPALISKMLEEAEDDRVRRSDGSVPNDAEDPYAGLAPAHREALQHLNPHRSRSTGPRPA